MWVHIDWKRHWAKAKRVSDEIIFLCRAKHYIDKDIFNPLMALNNFLLFSHPTTPLEKCVHIANTRRCFV